MSNPSQSEATNYLKALKQILKERGIRYSHLSERLQVSLPTVKRILNKPSLPLDRLLEICSIAKINFKDLSELAQRQRRCHYLFNTRQDRLFADSETHLKLFLSIAVDGLNPTAASKSLNIPPKSLNSYLRDLEQANLLERLPSNKVKLLATPPFGFGPNSQYLNRDLEQTLKSIFSLARKGEGKKQGNLAIIKPLRLSDKDWNLFRNELENTIDRFAAISETKLKNRSNTSHRKVAIVCQGSVRDSPLIQLAEPALTNEE